MVFVILENVKKLICFFAIFILGGQMVASEKDDDVPYIRYAKEIMNPFIQECEKNYDLDCIGTGGQFAKNVAEISIKFIAYRKGSIEEARTLEVKMIETLLAQVNAHEKIRSFLKTYPFDKKNLNISISFRQTDNSHYNDKSIAYVSHIKNKLFYDISDPKTAQLLDCFEEPYEEALKIVYGNASEVKKMNTSPDSPTTPLSAPPTWKKDIPQDKPKS